MRSLLHCIAQTAVRVGKRLKDIFDLAINCQPSVVVLDDLHHVMENCSDVGEDHTSPDALLATRNTQGMYDPPNKGQATSFVPCREYIPISSIKGVEKCPLLGGFPISDGPLSEVLLFPPPPLALLDQLSRLDRSPATVAVVATTRCIQDLHPMLVQSRGSHLFEEKIEILPPDLVS